ncbi:hypothetical protein [Amycolatopsis alkalitolerans]|uniref:Uncharacterized protein n=1 Tax=Amycolatopsis alkalitolerans TaxID=2547244 RepID=A0A5C4LWF9_9PSEU|nr:hypothetical protein [Amycolatopsis alkalitolerans]TNC23782.1 hypothetical protein FG385_20735 [Amycolatopsis alkalitolerans]
MSSDAHSRRIDAVVEEFGIDAVVLDRTTTLSILTATLRDLHAFEHLDPTGMPSHEAEGTDRG